MKRIIETLSLCDLEGNVFGLAHRFLDIAKKYPNARITIETEAEQYEGSNKYFQVIRIRYDDGK